MSTMREGEAPLAALRRATAADHESVDQLIDPDRLVEIGYYAAVVGGLIEAAEHVEVTLPLIPSDLCAEGLSPSEVSKRLALDDESAFLDEVAGPRPLPRPSGLGEPLQGSGPHVRAAILGLLYVYVGSGFGGLRLLRVARTAPWWQCEREQLLLRPYGAHLDERWRAVLTALALLDSDETNAAATAARVCFDLHRRSLVDHLSVGGGR
ncbi:biliverdin-producing heme oxygenase [Mycolicibacterium hodleri]|uniref:Heme oxygenase n=1 Tax=Mycolicibacterium hodleri TaxID=49897 RepID=A0A502E3I9_9MYCO|nr:biliverdin-producing heme oxygenase [Mycolicibacterium hodleri]TPG32183.1 hypothetical protein EAH80_20360 [Mycolicibacterium hodleri]